MTTGFQIRSISNLVYGVIKSSIALMMWITIFAVGSASAHEVRPAIGDVTISQNEVLIDLQVNLEAFVAGVDLSAVDDTNLSDKAADYDTLRALSPAELESRFRAFWPTMRDGISLKAGEQDITPELVDVEVEDEPNVELLRDATLKLRADLPADNSPVTVGWNAKFGPLVMRQMGGGDDAYTALLRNGETSAAMPRTGVATQSGFTVFTNYIAAGFEHILPLGLDHILFVLGLFFLSPKIKPLLWQVTTFTLAHTITLALGILGLVSVKPEIVEPLIAASIVYVAIENLLTSEIKPWRLLLIFGFGLLHGLGFATVLGEFGLDGSHFVTSLIGFNIGVELGQLTVIAIAFLAVGLWFSHKPFYRKYISNPASVVIGLVGAYWFIERVFL